jgi:hypothetical protein
MIKQKKLILLLSISLKLNKPIITQPLNRSTLCKLSQNHFNG